MKIQLSSNIRLSIQPRCLKKEGTALIFFEKMHPKYLATQRSLQAPLLIFTFILNYSFFLVLCCNHRQRIILVLSKIFVLIVWGMRTPKIENCTVIGVPSLINQAFKFEPIGKSKDYPTIIEIVFPLFMKNLKRIKLCSVELSHQQQVFTLTYGSKQFMTVECAKCNMKCVMFFRLSKRKINFTKKKYYYV